MTMTQPDNEDRRSLVAIEHVQTSPVMPGQAEWKMMHDMAASLVPTGFLPKGIDTPEKAVAVMLKGRELNVPPMYALSNIAIVQGKPTVSAEMMLALIYRDHGKQAIRVKESTDARCTVEYRLDGWNDTSAYTFTIDQAKQAGLTKNPTWSNYPAAMLRARCISAVARMAFPECIAGMYVPGELGDDVRVTDDGEVAHVDTATGEIVDAPRSAEDRPRAIEPPKDEPEPIDDEENHQRAIKHIHAAARDVGISHHVLSHWAKEAARKNGSEIESMAEAPTAWLDGMARWVKNNPAKSRKLAAEVEPLPMDEAIETALANATPTDVDTGGDSR